MSDIKHGGFAFPQSNPDVAYSDYIGGGMTLSDYFAGQALVGLYASKEVQEDGWDNEDIAYHCYAVADAMLKAREVKP